LTPFSNYQGPVNVPEFSMVFEQEVMYKIRVVVEDHTSCNILDGLGIFHYMWCLGRAM